MLWQMVFLHVVTFLAIVFALRRLLYAESVKETQRLRELKEEAFLKQQELDEKIREAGRVYAERVRQANEEIAVLRSKAENEIEQMRARIVDEAEKEAERIIKAAFNAKEKMCEEIAAGLKRKAPALAIEIFKNLLSEEAKKVVHNDLVEELVLSLKEMDLEFSSAVDTAEVCCAYPLLPSQIDEIEKVLASRVGHKVSLDIKQDEDLVAGVVLRVGSLEIDGDLNTRLVKIEEEIRNS